MTKKWLFLTVCLILVLVTACAPEASSTDAPAAGTEPPTAALPAATLAEPTFESATQPPPTEEASVSSIATSRGPDLHATDPTTVSLASGGLQFVEFFRFT
jgi:hypothetical protein